MADNKRTRRSSEEVWQDKIRNLEGKRDYIQSQLDKVNKEIEDMKNNPPKAKSKKSVQTLIKEMSNDPIKLTQILNDSKGDEAKLKELLLQALES